MKAGYKMFAVILIMVFASSVIPYKAPAQGVTVGFQVFYDELSPYGTWVSSPDYGYVWIPDVDPGFSPYSTNGYWVFTNEGWTWISDYAWGWAPFHYGRWYVDPHYGQMWVPGYEWGPGWVTWRRSEGFYGWAPIGPGVTLNVAYGSGYYVPNEQWTFVRAGDFGRTNINRYYINNTYNVTIIKSSTVIHNTSVDRSRHVTYNTGPERSEVEKRSGKRFSPVAIKESSRPGQNMKNNQLEIYRPKVHGNTSTRVKPAPARVERMENVKTKEQRRPVNPSQKSSQPARQQPAQQKHQAQPQKQQPQQEQRTDPPARQQPSQQQQKQKPQQHQQAQPAKQQPQQQKQQKPPQSQQQKQQHQTQPARQQPAQPAKQKPQQPQHTDPAKNVDGDKESQKNKPPKTT